MTRINSCDIEPFRYEATPQTDGESGASAGEINQQQLEDYLNRFKQGLCDDWRALLLYLGITGDEIPTDDQPQPYIDCSRGYTIINFGVINSNKSETRYFEVTNLPLGVHLISWAANTPPFPAGLDDLVIDMMVVFDNVLRVVANNVSSGNINADPILFEIVTGYTNPALPQTNEFLREIIPPAAQGFVTIGDAAIPQQTGNNPKPPDWPLVLNFDEPQIQPSVLSP